MGLYSAGNISGRYSKILPVREIRPWAKPHWLAVALVTLMWHAIHDCTEHNIKFHVHCSCTTHTVRFSQMRTQYHKSWSIYIFFRTSLCEGWGRDSTTPPPPPPPPPHLNPSSKDSTRNSHHHQSHDKHQQRTHMSTNNNKKWRWCRAKVWTANKHRHSAWPPNVQHTTTPNCDNLLTIKNEKTQVLSQSAGLVNTLYPHHHMRSVINFLRTFSQMRETRHILASKKWHMNVTSYGFCTGWCWLAANPGIWNYVNIKIWRCHNT